MTASSVVVLLVVAAMALTIVQAQTPPYVGIFTDNACKVYDKTWNPNPLSLQGLPQDNSCISPPQSNISASLLCKQSSATTTFSFQIFSNTQCTAPSVIDFEVANQPGPCYAGSESIGGIVTKAWFNINCNNSTDVQRVLNAPRTQRIVQKMLQNTLHSAGI